MSHNSIDHSALYLDRARMVFDQSDYSKRMVDKAMVWKSYAKIYEPQYPLYDERVKKRGEM